MSRVRRLLLRSLAPLILILLLAPTLASPALGQQQMPSGTTSERIAELRRRLSEAQGRESDLLALIQESDKRLAELSTIVADLTTRLEDARRRLGSAQYDLDYATAAYLNKLDAVEHADRLYVATRDRLSMRIIRMYKEGNLGEIDLILNAKSITELGQGRSYLNRVAADDQHSATQLAELRDTLDGERMLLEDTRANLLESRNRIDAETDELTRLHADNQAARDLANAESENQRQLLTQVLADKNQTQRMLDELEGASNRAASDLGIEGSRGNPSIVPGYFVWPADGPLTSRYGTRVHPISGARKLHAGVDIGAPSGAPIRAAASGLVLRAGPYGGYGLATIIDHGNGLATLYAHQSRIGVSAGQQVAQGQTIGSVGSTGYSTGPHLHFEVRINGQPRDPLLWFPERG